MRRLFSWVRVSWFVSPRRPAGAGPEHVRPSPRTPTAAARAEKSAGCIGRRGIGTGVACTGGRPGASDRSGDAWQNPMKTGSLPGTRAGVPVGARMGPRGFNAKPTTETMPVQSRQRLLSRRSSGAGRRPLRRRAPHCVARAPRCFVHTATGRQSRPISGTPDIARVPRMVASARGIDPSRHVEDRLLGPPSHVIAAASTSRLRRGGSSGIRHEEVRVAAVQKSVDHGAGDGDRLVRGKNALPSAPRAIRHRIRTKVRIVPRLRQALTSASSAKDAMLSAHRFANLTARQGAIVGAVQRELIARTRSLHAPPWRSAPKVGGGMMTSATDAVIGNEQRAMVVRDRR
jgi:hypothetical protein